MSAIWALRWASVASAGTVAAVVEFTDKDAGDVAVPLERIVTLPEAVTPAEIERAVATHGYSRYVIVDESGDPVGYVHLKDVLRAADDADKKWDNE